MPKYVFVPEGSLAAVTEIEAADPAAALAKADLGPLPQKIVAVEVIGTYWVLDESDSQVVRKATASAAVTPATLE